MEPGAAHGEGERGADAGGRAVRGEHEPDHRILPVTAGLGRQTGASARRTNHLFRSTPAPRLSPFAGAASFLHRVHVEGGAGVGGSIALVGKGPISAATCGRATRSARSAANHAPERSPMPGTHGRPGTTAKH